MTNRPHDDQSLLHLIGETSRSVVTLFDAELRCMGLSAARGRVLLFLLRHRVPVGQAQVTEYLRVEGPTAVRILDGLEALGAIRRLPDPHDRRAKLIELTQAGRPDAEQVAELTRRINARLLDGLSAKQIRDAQDVLSTIVENACATPGVVKETLPDAVAALE
jgi:MarR family transcriptional regulator for hemolysin